MAEVSLNLQKLAQRNLQTEEELRHVRRFLSLVEQCREYDTMHPGQLRDMQQRLEAMARNLAALHSVTDEAIERFAAMDRDLAGRLEASRQRTLHPFDN